MTGSLLVQECIDICREGCWSRQVPVGFPISEGNRMVAVPCIRYGFPVFADYAYRQMEWRFTGECFACTMCCIHRRWRSVYWCIIGIILDRAQHGLRINLCIYVYATLRSSLQLNRTTHSVIHLGHNTMLVQWTKVNIPSWEALLFPRCRLTSCTILEMDLHRSLAVQGPVGACVECWQRKFLEHPCNIMPIIFEHNLHYNRGLLLDLVERCRIRLEVNRSPGSTPGPRLRVYSVACNCLY